MPEWSVWSEWGYQFLKFGVKWGRETGFSALKWGLGGTPPPKTRVYAGEGRMSGHSTVAESEVGQKVGEREL